MIIKKYQGKTEDEAMEIAKKELGDSIVLMNVRVVKQKGLMRLFKAPFLEITVAKEEESEQENKVKERVVSDKENNNLSGMTKEKAAAGLDIRIDEFAPTDKDDSVLEEKIDSIHQMIESQIKENVQKKSDTEEERGDEKTPRDEVLGLIEQMLKENELDENYVEMIISDAKKNIKGDVPMEQILSHIYQRMILYFGTSQKIAPADKGSKVIFFVGTTGVGKTTTIAKIASKLVIEDKKKVALVTADTYRIAAAEQLRTYAGILEVPFKVLYEAEEIEGMIEDFKEYDYILIDTAGHSQNNTVKQDVMSGFIERAASSAETEVYLVLSATAKYKDLLHTADNYKRICDYKLIFTKLDETDTYGNLLNIKMHTGAPICYITYGQNVPDDFDNFNAQGTVKKLLGGK